MSKDYSAKDREILAEPGDGGRDTTSNNKKFKDKKRSNKRRSNGKRNKATNKEVPKYTNDPSWYISDNMYANTVGSVSFGKRLGSSYSLYQDENGSANIKIPGIMSLWYAPAIGIAKDSTSPINVAARRIYTMLTNNSGRTSSYTPADVMQVMLAYAEVLKGISFAIRTMACLYVSNIQNAYYPRTLIESANIDYTDLDNRIHEYVGRLQATIVKANRITVPSDLPIFHKAWTQFSRVYLDDNNALTQIYVPSPAYLWYYNEDLEGAPMLMPHKILKTSVGGVTQKVTMEELISNINDMIERLYNSQACIDIMADILRLADKKEIGLYAIPQFDNAMLYAGPEAVYHEEFLLQLKNSTFIGAPTALNTVEQDAINANLVSTPKWNLKYPTPMLNKMLTSKFGNLPPQEVILATRYAIMSKSYETISDSVANRFQFKDDLTVGDSILTNIYVTTGPGEMYFVPSDVIDMTDASWTAGKSMSDLLAILTQFNHKPMFMLGTSATSSSSNWTFSGYIESVDNFTLLSYEQLEAMNTAALLTFYSFDYTPKSK